MKTNKEQDVTSMIKSQIENMSENKLLWLSLGAIGASFILQAYKKDKLAILVRQWAIPLVVGGLAKQASKAIGTHFS